MGRDSEIAEIGRALREEQRKIRESNLSHAEHMIERIGKETGAQHEIMQHVPMHLRFRLANNERFDFWPSTRRWMVVGAKKKNRFTSGGGPNGLETLIERMKVNHEGK